MRDQGGMAARRSSLAGLAFCTSLACGSSIHSGQAGASGTGGSAGTVGSGGAAGSLGSAASGGGAGTASGGHAGTASIPPDAGTEESVTEWNIPFTNSWPRQIAVAGSTIVYRNGAYDEHFGKVDTEHDTATEWPLPYSGSDAPADLEIRPSDGAVFLTFGPVGEIGQFDLETQVLRRWPLPLDVQEPSGPFSLAFDDRGRVVFSGFGATGPLIGRLDTTTGGVDTWAFPYGGIGQVVMAPDGSVSFPIGGATGPSELARLDLATGVFTVWPLNQQPSFAAVGDAGNLYYFEAEFVGFYRIARLVPATGQINRWSTPAWGESLTLEAGHLFYADGNQSLYAVDPAAPSDDLTSTPTVSAPVAPRSSVATSTTVTLVGQTAAAARSVRAIRRLDGSPSTWWYGIPGAHMLATAPGAVYVTEGAPAQAIARLDY